MEQPSVIRIEISKLQKALWIVAVVLCAIGVVAHYCIYKIAEHQDSKFGSLMQRFDLGFEPSLPGYFSAFILLVSSFLLWVIFRIERSDSTVKRANWLCLSLIFFYLSLDEAIMIHEMTDGALQKMLQTSGIFYLAWVIPGIVFVTVIGICFLPFLYRLEATTRNLFIVAGAVFVGGAIGMEMVAAGIVEDGQVSSMRYAIIQTIEEGMEMAGVLIFIYGLQRYIRLISPSVTFQLGAAGNG